MKACCRPEIEIEGGDDEIGGKREVEFSRPRTDKMQQKRRSEKKELEGIDEARKATAKVIVTSATAEGMTRTSKILGQDNNKKWDI